MKQLDPREAVSLGVVQEVNRLFLHPIGLALGVRVDDITNVAQLFLWDAREDPEGIYFPDEIIHAPTAVKKAKAVREMLHARAMARQDTLGYIIQPIAGVDA